MSKLLGVAGLAASLLFAIACGSNDTDVADSGFSYKTSVAQATVGTDSSALSDYTVSLKQGGETVTSTSMFEDATVTGEDVVLTISDIVASGDYTLEILNQENVVLSDLITVDSTSGDSADGKQLNTLTSLAKSSVSTANLPKPTVFVTSISDLFGTTDPEQLLVNASGNIDSDAVVVSAAVSKRLAALDVATKAIAKAGSKAAADAIASSIADIVTASESDLDTLISIVVTTALAYVTTLETSDLKGFAARFVPAATFASIKSTVTATGFDLATISTVASNNVAAITSQIDAALSVVVSDFGLADDSFGSKSGGDFTIGTRAPVFMVAFEDAVVAKGAAAASVELSVGTKSPTAASSQLTNVWASSNMLYIAVKKDYVEAGESYDYTITGNATSLAAIETAGTITVMPVTITSSEVAINFTGTDWNGVAASDISFLVNSSSNIEVDYDETDLDLINDITVDGLDGSYTAGDVSFTVSANTATAVTEATLTLPTAISAKLVAGESYTVEADLDLEVEDGDVLVEGTDYISTLKVDIEAAE